MAQSTLAGRSWILHVDLDQFIAAVEVLRRPELRGLPVVVGGNGDPTQLRQVVATASYEARTFGVRSGMPLRTALARCPQAVFLASDAPAYEAASARVMGTLRTFPIVVEVWGWDEAFLGARTDDPEALARQIQLAVREATALECSIGIGDNKLRAKIATGFAKPAGVYRLTKAEWMQVMGERPTVELWGIGAKTARKLDGLGVHTVAQLAAADPDELAARFGPTIGPYLRDVGRGAGSTTVSAEPWEPRSRSRETTFRVDLVERAAVEEQVDRLARELAAEAESEGRQVFRVGVKVRVVPFFTNTREHKLAEPTTDTDTVAKAAVDLLDKFDLHRPVRLLGVRVDFRA